MEENKIKVLCTRLLNEPLITKAADKNVLVDTVPFIETESINTQEIKERVRIYGQQSVTAIFSSYNAVESVISHLDKKSAWKIFCMGGNTKELVYGFFGEDAIAGTAKNATALAEKIILSGDIKDAVFFCGDLRLNDLPEMLAANDINVQELIVYNTVQTPVFIEKNYDSVIFFSPSAVHSFFSVNTLHTDVVIFSIGKTTTAIIQSYCTNPVITSEWPGKDQMIEQVLHHFETINQEK